MEKKIDFSKMKSSELLDNRPSPYPDEELPYTWEAEVFDRHPFLTIKQLLERVAKLEDRIKNHRHESSKRFTGRAEY